MRGIWSTNDFRHEGRRFTAYGQTAAPRPVQRPHPPFWFGGNSPAVRRRVARCGQGWSPLLNDVTAATTTRTALIDTTTKLSLAVAEVRQLAADAGRDPDEIAVQVETAASFAWAENANLEQHLDRLGELASAGATWFVVDPPGDDAEKGIDALHRYGADVIARATADLPT
jgi:alkanesulfonate monooxygenase SsuD/methylene tetrahydromethanopterin reductase-like flavin-dependent oxidoreductase (luciferase family)